MKNFIYLGIITAIIGIFLKFYFPSYEDKIFNAQNISLNENTIDSLIYQDFLLNQNKKNFHEFLIYYHQSLENIFENAIYDSSTSRHYALGNIYFKRYFEFLAARDLLCELNNNLYNKPQIDRFFSLPLLNNKEYNNLFDNYVNEIRDNYGLNKLHLKISNTKPASQYLIDDYIIYNPMLFEYYAKLFLDKSIYNINKYLQSDMIDKDRQFSCLVKLSLLYAKLENVEEVKNIFYKYINTEILINYLNTYDDTSDIMDLLDLEILDYLVELELANIINIKTIKKYYKKIENNELKLIYVLKRKLANLSDLDNNTIAYNCDTINDIFYAPEIMILISELNFKNHAFENSEDIITSFWFNCTKNKQDWIYNNYPSLLLRSIRLGHWHGAKIPTWYQYFRDHYVETTIDEQFSNLNITFKTWVVSTVGGIGGSDAGKE